MESKRLEKKRGFEFFRELPKKKQKVFRQAFIKARGLYNFQCVMKISLTREDFYASFFHLWTYCRKDAMYFMRCAGLTHDELTDIVLKEYDLGIRHNDVGFMWEYFYIKDRLEVNLLKYNGFVFNELLTDKESFLIG